MLGIGEGGWRWRGFVYEGFLVFELLGCFFCSVGGNLRVVRIFADRSVEWGELGNLFW